MSLERDLRNVAGHIEEDWGDLTYQPTGQSVVKLLRDAASHIREIEERLKTSERRLQGYIDMRTPGKGRIVPSASPQ